MAIFAIMLFGAVLASGMSFWSILRDLPVDAFVWIAAALFFMAGSAGR